MSQPAYANLIEPKPDEPVMRYMRLAQLLWILMEGKLPLMRVDLFRDPFEGSVPKSESDAEVVVAGGFYSRDLRHCEMRFWHPTMSDAGLGPRLFPDMTSRREARIRSSYASCWRCGPESEGMWRLYCAEGDGVALCTTFSRLKKSIVDKQILAGKVRYGNYDTMPPYNHRLDPVMHKRKGFEFEDELQLLRVVEELYKKLCTGPPEELRDCVPIAWCLKTAVDRILISPYAQVWYKEAVESAVRELGPGLRVEWSELRADRRNI